MADSSGKPKTDWEIAQAAKLRPIIDIARERLGIPAEQVEPYGHYKAKIGMDFVKDALANKPDGKLILVTAINPTPAGEGKTTTTVGLGDALNRIGKKAMICLREPSLGPCFGMKGGAAGGGYAQVVPMDEINLHFTGDFHAIGAANNLLAAMIDNHVYWGNELGIDPRRITWRRCLDMNDRALRQIVDSLGGVANGFPREDGFDITVASEIMAILCLSTRSRICTAASATSSSAQTRDRKPVRASAAQGRRRDGGAAEGRDQAQSGADARAQSRLHPWRPLRQHRAWLQLGDGDQAGAEARRLCRDRGRLRRRSGRREILRHQMPQGRAEARRRGGRRDGARAQIPWRRGACRSRHARMSRR